MGSLGAAADELESVCERAAECRVALALAGDGLLLAREWLMRASVGSGDPEWARVLACLEEVDRGISEVSLALAEGVRLAVDVVTALVGAEATGSSSGSDLPRAVDADAVMRRLPERSKANPKTHGTWFDGGGRERGNLVSGWDREQTRATGVLRELGIGPPGGELWASGHVEVKLAALLRGTGESTATLVVNNRPCDEGRWSCDRLLPRILRAGQQVVVHWPGGVTAYRGKAR